MRHWQAFLEAPAFCINLERRGDRRQGLIERIQAAGFSQVAIWPAIDGRTQDLEVLFKSHGLGQPISVDRFPERRGSQGSLLSHLGLLAHAIREGLPLVHIFEDDVFFPPIWTTHAKAFFRETPNDWDLLYFGSMLMYQALPHRSPIRFLASHPRLRSASSHLIPWPTRLLQDVVTCPLYCTHAYSLTQAGCLQLYKWITGQPVVYGYDNMIHDGMRRWDRVSPFPLKWYAWSSMRLIPDNASRGKDPDIIGRNLGVVFQMEEELPPALGDKR